MNKKVVIIDDNYVIRELLKSSLNKDVASLDDIYEFYTSESGVEGLGYIYSVNPDIVIIDATLPKYSGRELVEFLGTRNSKILVLVESEKAKRQIQEKSPHIALTIIIKDRNFLANIKAEINPQSNKQSGLINSIISMENVADRLARYAEGKIIVYKQLIQTFWFLTKLLGSFLFAGYYLFNSRVEDSVVEQNQKDLEAFRVKVYPTIAGVVSAFLFLILQVSLFVAGGITVLNVRVESMFALSSQESVVSFSEQANLIVPAEIDITTQGATLGKIYTKVASEAAEESAENMTEIESIEEAGEVEVDNGSTNEISETIDITDVSLVEQDFASEMNTEVITFPISSPFIQIEKGIGYVELFSLEVKADIVDTSGTRVGEGTSKDDFHLLTFQISPDAENWYYYEKGESNWEKTTLGKESSTSLEDLNANLSKYAELFPSGELFFRTYFNSNGGESAVLKEVIVKRNSQILVGTDNFIPEKIVETQSVSTLDFDVLEPVIFNASFVNGEKVVLGKVLNKDKVTKSTYSFEESVIAQYEARVYFSDEVEASKNAFIGVADLQINPRGEVFFLLQESSVAGGYVTAEIGIKQKQLASVEDGTVATEATAQETSSLARPVENSTFTVDSTGDEADLIPGNGICLTSAGTCTLRAAMEEAETLAGGDTINFNIPTSDPGFRDYNNPNVPSSGDGIGGNDYWSIRVATILPMMTTLVTIDGESQEILSGIDMNTAGPDIEIRPVTPSTVDYGIRMEFAGGGAYFFEGTPGGGSILRNVNVNQFTISQVTVRSSLLENSYICTDVRGFATVNPTSSQGVSTQLDQTISNNSLEIRNNVISNCLPPVPNDNAGGIVGGMRYGRVHNNIIGLDPSGKIAQPLTRGISMQAASNNLRLQFGSVVENNIIRSAGYCAFIRGGTGQLNGYNVRVDDNTCGLDVDLVYMGGSARGIRLATVDTASENVSVVSYELEDGNVDITNNYFGTDKTKTMNLCPVTNGCVMGVFRHGYMVYSPVVNFSNNTAYYANRAGVATGDDNFSINSFSNMDSLDLRYNRHGILVNNRRDILPIPNVAESTIKNSIITDNLYFGIIVMGRSPQIIGNRIENNGNGAILIRSGDHLAVNIPGAPIIGGTSVLSGSLCNGIEANCIENNSVRGILSESNPLHNVDTIYSDNVWGDGNGPDGEVNYQQAWTDTSVTTNIILDTTGNNIPLFEVFSGNLRRTSGTFPTLQVPSYLNFYYTYGSGRANTFVIPAANTTCNPTSTCPATGHTDGVVNVTKMVNGKGVVQYEIDNSGNKIDFSPVQVDEDNVVSNVFSFDGDNTTDPIVTSSPREISSQNYNDRGQPWTNDVSKTGDLATYDFPIYQTMEIDIVDGNPKWNGSEYIINMNQQSNLTNEDNVSAGGYNKGVVVSDEEDEVVSLGEYSGGGLSGVDGPANGVTTLFEAVTVAKGFGEVVKVKFNAIESLSGANYTDFYPTQTIDFHDIAGSNLVIIDGDLTEYTNFFPSPKTKVVIDGSLLPGGQSCFSFSNVQNIEIRNIEFRNCQNNAITIGNGATGIMVDPASVVFANNPSVNAIINLVGGTEDVYGTTENDADDSDAGPNSLLNHAVIEEVTYLGGGQYLVEGDLDNNQPSETPKTVYICRVQTAHISGHGGCTDYLGNGASESPWAVTVGISGDDGTQGRIFTAVTVNALRDTSEFSPNFTADSLNPDYFILEYEIPLVAPIGNVSDPKPLFDWTPTLDPDIKEYRVYLNGDLITVVPAAQTEYLYTGDPLAGEHEWQVIGVRQNDTLVNESIVGEFTVQLASGLAPVYPLQNVTIDNRKPQLRWSDSNYANIDQYIVYVNGVQVAVLDGPFASDVNGFTLENDLDYAAHTWSIESYRTGLLADDSSVVELVNSFEVEFTVGLPTSSSGNVPSTIPSAVFVTIPLASRVPRIPLIPIEISDRILTSAPAEFVRDVVERNPAVRTTIDSALVLGLLAPLGVVFAGSMIGGINIVSMIDFIMAPFFWRKRKYWGKVTDFKDSNKPVPFARVSLFSGMNVLASVSANEDGDYYFTNISDGSYTLVANIPGYKKSVQFINLANSHRPQKDANIQLIAEDLKITGINVVRYYRRNEIKNFVRFALLALVVIGFVATIMSIFISPNIFNFIVLTLYMVLVVNNSISAVRYIKLDLKKSDPKLA